MTPHANVEVELAQKIARVVVDSLMNINTNWHICDDFCYTMKYTSELQHHTVEMYTSAVISVTHYTYHLDL